MNWGAIKSIYRYVLIHKNKIEYLSGDKYKLISFYLTGEKHWEEEYQNGLLHGKIMYWYKDGQKWWEEEYQNGQLYVKRMFWHENGQKRREREYRNGKSIR